MKSKKLKSLLKRGFTVTLFVFTFYIFINIITPYQNTLKNRATRNQINYLSKILNKGYDDELQKRFPEGKIFSNCIFALSLIKYSEKHKDQNKRIANEIDNCIFRSISPKAINNFEYIEKPKYGMFYNGWLLHTLKHYQKSDVFKDSSIQNELNQLTDTIEQRLINSFSENESLLDSYPDQNWPADNLIGISVLDSTEIQRKWLSEVFRNAKHKSSLIHHSGELKNNIRGSSQAMILYCLNKMDYKLTNEYDKLYKEIFIDNYLGVQLVKENEDGSNFTDVDSGPVILGYGASATVMNLKTRATIKPSSAKASWAFMNTLAIPINLFGEKYYLFKAEPMFDIFMLWSLVEL